MFIKDFPSAFKKGFVDEPVNGKCIGTMRTRVNKVDGIIRTPVH